jgi:flavin-dependent dehydrogenase
MVQDSSMFLSNGSRVAIIGGGPAGAFFSYFLLRLGQRIDVNLHVDIYEPHDFTSLGPAGCKGCAGVISESLIQALSIEGINLPPSVVQRGIDSFVFHSATENVTMNAPFSERRIATVYRGGGPRGVESPSWQSFDNHMLGLALANGANLIRGRVTDLSWAGDRPQVHVEGHEPQNYDLIVGAVGINSPAPTLFEKLVIGYKRPKVRKTANIEFELGAKYVSSYLGNSMHAYLLNLPSLDFSALIPKGDYVTMCLIGDNINSEFVDNFMCQPSVSQYLGNIEGHESGACRCAPVASYGTAIHPYGDRVVLIGDCGVSRLNKDGIGSAYRTAKTAAVTALFTGISSEDFRLKYWPFCEAIIRDNKFGTILYMVVGIMKKAPFLTRGVMSMIRREQAKRGSKRRMGMVMWDVFTGSAPYRDVFLRCLHPAFIGDFLWNIIAPSNVPLIASKDGEEAMESGTLGRLYRNGEVIIRQGESGDCMYVVQSGRAEVIQEKDGKEVRLAILETGDVFGEMALFRRQVRSATVRALGEIRALSVDKRIFLKRVHEDPSFAYRIMQRLSDRIYDLDAELVRIKS